MRGTLAPRVTRWLLRLTALALSGWALSAHAATYAFRSDTYSWETAANEITWDGTCTSWSNSEDKATINFTGGFKFTFGGVAYSSVRVLTNGALQFGAETGLYRQYPMTTLPAGNAPAEGTCTAGPTTNAMMVNWADLITFPGLPFGNVTWEQKGTAPNRFVVVSWNSVYQYRNFGDPITYTFQVILYENGEFKYQYGNSPASGTSATIGVQRSTSDYTLYSYNSGYNLSNSAIRWYIPSSASARIAEYRMDEDAWNGTLNEVADTTLNGHNGIRVGSATTVASGKVCRALDVPSNTTAAAISAVDTALDVDAAIGNTAGTASVLSDLDGWLATHH